MKINIINSINSGEYSKAIKTVYTPNSGPITEGIVLPKEGAAALNSANVFYSNNGEILKQATINLNPKS